MEHNTTCACGTELSEYEIRAQLDKCETCFQESRVVFRAGRDCEPDNACGWDMYSNDWKPV